MDNFQLKVIENPTPSILESLKDIMISLFKEWDPHWVLGTIAKHQHSCLILSQDKEAQKTVGFKLGYATSNKSFYSFLGGVLPEYRKKGLALKMADQQELWCRNNGFKKITTKSMNQFKPMVILNLKNGFEITGTEWDERGKLKILFEKEL